LIINAIIMPNQELSNEQKQTVTKSLPLFIVKMILLPIYGLTAAIIAFGMLLSPGMAGGNKLLYLTFMLGPFILVLASKYFSRKLEKRNHTGVAFAVLLLPLPLVLWLVWVLFIE